MCVCGRGYGLWWGVRECGWTRLMAFICGLYANRKFFIPQRLAREPLGINVNNIFFYEPEEETFL